MNKWIPDIALLNRLRMEVGSFFLKKEMRVRRREVQSMGLDAARSIGLVFNAKDEHTFKQVREFADQLRGGGLRKVKALGYVPKSEVAGFLQSSQDFDFFSRDDFNWYYRPQGRKVAGFISEPFDVLIDLRLNRFIPILFIVGLSRAHFKVGRFFKGHEEFYDLMIDVDDKAELPYFISQVQHYLSMLNTDK